MKLIWITLAGTYLSILLNIAVWSNYEKTGSESGWQFWALVAVYIILGIINFGIGILNVLAAIRKARKRDYAGLRRRMLTIKLASIPYFLVNFAINYIIYFVLLGMSRGFLIFAMPLIFALPVFFTYLTVLFTSAYGIGYLIVLPKEKMPIGWKLLHMVLQICFVLDMVDTIVLSIKHKSWTSDLLSGDGDSQHVEMLGV